MHLDFVVWIACLNFLICMRVDRGCQSGVGCDESVKEEGAGVAGRKHETESRTELLERVVPPRGHGGSREYITHTTFSYIVFKISHFLFISSVGGSSLGALQP